MKKFVFAAMLLCFSISNAQITFEKGYFINNSGMRIDCYIENMDWNNNPKSFTYKLLENSESKNENYMGVREFGIDNVSMYKRFTVKVERSPTEQGLIHETNILLWKEETLFLKALVTGNASLYILTDSNITRYFYETQNTPIEQLIHFKYASNNEGKLEFEYYVKENNQFRQQLLNSLKCGTTESDFSKLEYTKTPLTNIFVKYNNCSNSSTAVNYTSKDKHKVFSLKVTPGIYSGSMSISDPGKIYNVSSDFSAIVFKLGLEAEFTLPFNKNTWSIFVNPAYDSFNATKSFSKPDNITPNPELINYNAEVKYSAIEIPIGLRRYFFLNESSKIFVNAAYAITVNLSGKAEFTNTQKINANNSVDLSGRSNIVLGAGYCFKRFSGEIRLNTSRNVVNGYISWTGNYNTAGVVLGYRLF